MAISHLDQILVLETKNWKFCSRETLGHGVGGVSFSRNTEIVAAASTSNAIEIVSAQNCSSRIYIKGHGNCARGVCFSPTEDILASSADDERVKLWTIPPDILSHRPENSPHWDYVFQVRFSPTGRHVASRAWESSAIIWDVPSGQPLYHLSTGSNDGGILDFSLLEFSLDGRWLLSWGYNNPLKVWHTTTGQVLLELPLEEPADEYRGCDATFDESGLVVTHDSFGRKHFPQFKPINKPQIRPDLRVEGQWVLDAASGERLVWLPTEFRPVDYGHTAHSVYDNTIARGTGSGHVYFMGISQESQLNG